MSEAVARWSTLKAILRSPAHYAHAIANQREDSDSMRIGRAIHKAVLEPDLFDSAWTTWTGARRAGKEWDAFEAMALESGREVLNQKELAQVNAVARSVLSNADAVRLLSNGRAEFEHEWTDEETGIRCGGRVDYVGPNGVVDLKSCMTAEPTAFGAAAFRLMYHAQLAWYADGLGMPDVPLSIIAVESSAPHVVVVYTIEELEREIGRAEYREALKRLAECRKSGRWPGYAVGPTPLSLPRRAYPSDDDDVSALELEGLSA